MGQYLANYLNAITDPEQDEVRAALVAVLAEQMFYTIADVDVEATVTASSTSEEVLATIALPALRVRSRILVKQVVAPYTNSGNNKTMRLRLGGTGLDGTIVSSLVLTTSVATSDERIIKNQGATNSQRCFIAGTGGWGSTTNAMSTAAVETNAGTNLYITGQKATGAETLTLDSYSVEVLLGPVS